MEFHGKVIFLDEPRGGISQRNGEPWQSQDFVVEKDGRYPVRVAFNLFGSDRIKEAALKLGEFVTVKFDISARQYQGKWYNDVSAYKIERGSGSGQSANDVANEAVADMFAETRAEQQQMANDDQPF